MIGLKAFMIWGIFHISHVLYKINHMMVILRKIQKYANSMSFNQIQSEKNLKKIKTGELRFNFN